MISTIRAIAKLSIVVVAVAAFLHTAPSYAALPQVIFWVSSSGQDVTGCGSAAVPCASISYVASIIENLVSAKGLNSLIICSGANDEAFAINNNQSNSALELYCPGGNLGAARVSGTNFTLRIHHMIFPGVLTSGLLVTGNGTVILDDCDFADYDNAALDLEPNGPLNLVIRNSRISNSASGMLLKPAAGGSIHAKLDHVTINKNVGGGIRIDSTNGPISVDMTDSDVSANGGNGINVVGGAGGQNIVNIKNSVFSVNGAAGVQANGANAGVLIGTTLFDQNAAGAISAVGGGHVSTYGNNSIVGSAGSGFTGPAPLQ
jgi:hypothetical protein